MSYPRGPCCGPGGFFLLALILLVSFGLNARMAANPRSAYQSADERVRKLAIDIAENHHYGGPATGMGQPLHGRPGRRCCSPPATRCSRLPRTQTFDIRAAYWEQALLTTGTTALAALLAWLLAGPWAGVVAGAIVGTTRR
jgi:hypothetical protein